MPDWAQLRTNFPALEGCVYLDTASFGQLPSCAVDAITQHFLHRNQTASTRYLSWFDDMDRLRHSCSRLLNCLENDVAFVPSASTGLAWLMQGLEWMPGDEVITVNNEFPNQLYQSAAAQAAGVTFRAVDWPDFYDAISSKTRLVLMSTVNYANGFRPPVKEISDLLRQRNVLFYLDGTQSVGALDFDVAHIRPSVLCVDAYKWMLSPNGAGFVFIDPTLRTTLAPSVIGWRSDRGWREVNSLNHGIPVFPDSAQRYEGGMLPFPSLYAMAAVIDLLLETGMRPIEERVLGLAGETRQMLIKLGAEVNTDESQIVTARIAGRDSTVLANELKKRNIIVSARHGRLRISPHFYNDESDIDALRHAVQQVLG